MIRTNILFALMIPALSFGQELPENIIYLHPKPDAVDICYKTGIILRIDPAFQESYEMNDFTFTVTGEKSGNQPGRLVKSDNNILFQLDNAYEPGEKVTVVIQTNKLGWTAPYTYQFSVNKLTYYYLYKSAVQSVPTAPSPILRTMGEITTINSVSVPSDFPLFEPEILTQDVSLGKIFLNNWDGTPYIMIFENDGTPYFYQRVGSDSRDFKIQPNGELSRHVGGEFAVMDSSCNIIRYVQSGYGYLTDEHDFLILPDGHYFLISVGNREVDMSQIVSDGKKNANIKDTNIQEFDENGNIIFEWLCFEYFNIEDAIHEDMKASRIDYVHMNSVAIDYDDNIIVSSRHLSEITKINRQTGDIIWRLGGVNNQFTYIDDEFHTSYQHDARPVPGKPDHYTVFDNGNYHSPRFSRAIEYKLNIEDSTATKVWEYRLPQGSTWWLGNVQHLPNGNTHINWADASVPKATEVTPEGKVVYQADFVSPSSSYRTFRFEWEHVSEKPYLIVENDLYHVNLIFNKFGDKTVKEYQLFAGEQGSTLHQIAVTSNTFYTLSQNELENDRWYSFRVKAVHVNGTVSVSSNTESIHIKFIVPGEELVQNGDFSDRFNNWTWNVTGGANASRVIDSEQQFKFEISNGGSEYYHIQATQPDIPLIKDLSYSFEFDAYADSPRLFEAKLTKNGDPYTNYGEIGPTYLTTSKKHFTYEFIMKNASDTQARVVLNAGSDDADVYVDNVSVKIVDDMPIKQEHHSHPESFELYQNYPNPFNPSTFIRFNLTKNTHVKLTIYDIRGREIATLINCDMVAGFHQILFDADPYAAGIYFYRLQTAEYENTRKMVLIK
jgi:hypothetical protein